MQKYYRNYKAFLWPNFDGKKLALKRLKNFRKRATFVRYKKGIGLAGGFLLHFFNKYLDLFSQSKKHLLF
jgi:hypothetical protein